MPMLHRLKNSVTTTVYQSATQAIKQTHLFSEAKYQILKSGKKKKCKRKKKTNPMVQGHYGVHIMCQELYWDFASNR